MSIVILTRKNFTSLLKDRIDNMGVEGMFASALLGGKEKMKEAFNELPEEQQIYIDTKYIMSATGLIKVQGTDEVVFQITLANNLKDGQNVINIKGEEYEDFIRVWRGEREFLTPGTYKVGFGQDCKEPWAKEVHPKLKAEVSEDGLIITVKEL